MNRFLKLFIELIIVFIVFYIISISIDNGKIILNPKDWIAETVYLINLKPISVPAKTSALSEKVKSLVDPRLFLAFYLIQRDPTFSYLAQFAIDNQIQIEIKDGKPCGGDPKACYLNFSSGCSISHPGVIYLDSSLAKSPVVPWATAGIMIHELTHAWNRLGKSSYYCAGKSYLSDEYFAFKNQELFKRQYERFGFLDYFNREGNLNEYCLYSNTKLNYKNLHLIDDMNLKPANNISSIFCPLYSDLTTF